jgi:signal transduction histidine kinase
MIEQILVANGQMTWSSIAIWALGAALIIAAVMLIFIQRRQGRELRSELEQLNKLKKNNVEYEFVVKAMRLSTWHIDPKTMTVTYDYDYRDKRGGEWAPQLDGSKMSDCIPLLLEEDQERVRHNLKNICEGVTEDYHEQYRVHVPHSQRSYWEESFATVAKRDSEGKPESIVGTSMRIEERKTMEEALVAARNRAEESDRLKSAFIANMSHEIRTPLNAIIGFTSLLPDITGDEERRQLIDLISENNQKLLQIIDDVMKISKIEAGDDQLFLTTFDLNTVLSEVAERYRKKIADGVELQFHFADEAFALTTDQSRLQDIMGHLISNAAKFTQSGSITVGYDKLENRHVRITVKDTGKGIPEENLEQVFERFFKVDEFIPGAGLGLSTARTMAFSLGGTVGVDSKLGEGSTFWVDLPQK